MIDDSFIASASGIRKSKEFKRNWPKQAMVRINVVLRASGSAPYSALDGFVGPEHLLDKELHGRLACAIRQHSGYFAAAVEQI